MGGSRCSHAPLIYTPDGIIVPCDSDGTPNAREWASEARYEVRQPCPEGIALLEWAGRVLSVGNDPVPGHGPGDWESPLHAIDRGSDQSERTEDEQEIMRALVQPNDIEIPEGNPFEHDCLDREESVRILARLIGSVDGPGVFGIDAN